MTNTRNQLLGTFKMPIFILSISILTACSSTTKIENTKQNTIFPEPKEIQPNIAFWKKVYTEWDLNETILHDNVYLDVIYKKINYQDNINENQTDEEKFAIKAELETLKMQLASIESKVQQSIALDSSEKELIKPLIKAGGDGAIIGASERVRAQRGIKSRFKAGLEKSYAYTPYFKETFKLKGLPTQLAYLPHVESSFRDNSKSSVGASGMWQFMPSTAKNHMVMTKNIDSRLDPIISAEGAADYLQDSYDALGSWSYALTAYNHGTSGMSQAQAEWGDFGKAVMNYKGKNFGFASRNFYSEFVAAYQISENPEKYFSHYQPYPKLPKEAITLDNTEFVNDVSNFFNVSLETLETINPAWKNGTLNGKLSLPSGMIVWLPLGTVKSMQSSSASGRNIAYSIYR